MARRSDHTRDELKTLSLEAARRILDTKGYEAISVRSIAQEIGYSAGTLYNLFDGIDDLIIHMNAELLDDLFTALSGETITGDTEHDIHRMLDAYFRFIGDRKAEWEAITDHALPNGKPVPDWYKTKLDRLMDLLAAVIRPAIDGPDAAHISQQSAPILWASLQGIIALETSGKLKLLTPDSAKTLGGVLISNYLNGLKLTAHQKSATE